MRWRLRRAAACDLPRLLRFERRVFPLDAYPRELFEQMLEKCGTTFLVAEAGGALAGYIAACPHGSRAELISLGVAPRYRRQGAGSALMQRLLKLLKQRGVQRVSLMVRVENRAAATFYRGFGFRRTGRLRRYYDDGSDAFRMTLRLAPTASAGSRHPG